MREIVYPHTEDDKRVFAWVICPHCGEKHFVFPDKITPIWFCRGEICKLEAGQEIEVEYIDEANK